MLAEKSLSQIQDERRARRDAYFARRMRSKDIAVGWSGHVLTAETVARSLQDYAFIQPTLGRLIWAMEEGAIVIRKQEQIIADLRAKLHAEPH